MRNIGVCRAPSGIAINIVEGAVFAKSIPNCSENTIQDCSARVPIIRNEAVSKNNKEKILS